MLAADLGEMTTQEVLRLLVGAKFAEGQYRDVYDCELLPKCVLKVERGENHFCNPLEWIIWQELKKTRWAKWLAPCRHISACGIVLIQDRCKPFDRALPARVPGFLAADLKRENWGLLDGRPVCFDYGNNQIFELARKHSGMVKAEWLVPKG